jgi:Uma2 family endonuclease
MVTQARRIAIEEFLALPDDGNRHELVRGEARIMPPPKGRHGFVEAAISAAIDRYLEDRARSLGWEARQGLGARNALVGRVGSGEVGLQFAVPDDAVMVRGADIVFIPPEQLARVGWDGEGYFPAVPALVIEVISETDRAGAVAEKVQDYLAGGGQRVWCVYPDRHAIHIHDAAAPTRVVYGDDVATDPLLPGFSLPLNLIFA